MEKTEADGPARRRIPIPFSSDLFSNTAKDIIINAAIDVMTATFELLKTFESTYVHESKSTISVFPCRVMIRDDICRKCRNERTCGNGSD